MYNDAETIIFAGNEYPGRYVALPEFGNVLISVSPLNDALVGPTGAYVSSEARFVDEGICYFVEPDEIWLDEKQLVELLAFELDIDIEVE